MAEYLSNKGIYIPHSAQGHSNKSTLIELGHHAPKTETVVETQVTELNSRLVIAQHIIERLAGRSFALYQYEHDEPSKLLPESKNATTSTFDERFQFKQASSHLSGRGKIITNHAHFDFTYTWQQSQHFNISQSAIMTQSQDSQTLSIQIAQLNSQNTSLSQATSLPALSQGSAFINFHAKTQSENITMTQEPIFAQLSLWFSKQQAFKTLASATINNVLLATMVNPFRYANDINQALDPLRQSVIPLNEQGDIGFNHQVDVKI